MVTKPVGEMNFNKLSKSEVIIKFNVFCPVREKCTTCSNS